MRVLLTGGTGRLGKQLQSDWKSVELICPPRRDLDITWYSGQWVDVGAVDMVIHAAALVDTLRCESDPELAVAVNSVGTRRLAERYPDTPFVYISSEYAGRPELNVYARTKRDGELHVASLCKYHLIVRTSFKVSPFPYPKAYHDQYTLGDYLPVISAEIVKAIDQWDRRTSTLVYVGTGRKSILELARRTRPDVLPMSVRDVCGVSIPTDYI